MPLIIPGRSLGNAGAMVGDGLMDIKTTKLPGVLMLKPRRFSDVRGYYVETYNEQLFRQMGIIIDFVQDLA